MPEGQDLVARITILIQDARIKVGGGQIDIDVPRIEVVLPRDDCTEITRRMLPAESPASFLASILGSGKNANRFAPTVTCAFPPFDSP